MSFEQNIKSFVFMGCKHCGKTTHGSAIADYLKIPFFDTDTVIEKNVKMPFRQFYKENGPAAFLLEEEKACEQIIQNYSKDKIIVSTGGGICDNLPALTHLRQLGTFVFLKLDIDYSIKRVEELITQDDNGNFLNAPAYILNHKPKSMDEIHKLLMQTYEERFKKYEAIADVVIELKNAPVQENFNKICNVLL